MSGCWMPVRMSLSILCVYLCECMHVLSGICVCSAHTFLLNVWVRDRMRPSYASTFRGTYNWTSLSRDVLESFLPFSQQVNSPPELFFSGNSLKSRRDRGANDKHFIRARASRLPHVLKCSPHTNRHTVQKTQAIC